MNHKIAIIVSIDYIAPRLDKSVKLQLASSLENPSIDKVEMS